MKGRPVTVVEFLRRLVSNIQKIRLSTAVIVLFSGAMILPWCVLAWLVISARASQIGRTEDILEALAAGYAQHATMVIQDSKSDLESEMDAYRRALNLPNVSVSVGPIVNSEPVTRGESGGAVRVTVARPDIGIAVTASMDTDAALGELKTREEFEFSGLIVRTLIGAAIGIFLAQQLRWREKAQAELAIAREKAESSSRAKSDFLANMSHELRTPLNAIIGFSEIIRLGMHGPLNNRYREYGADIVGSGTHLLHLINEILDLSKLEAGKFELHEEEIELSTTMRASLRLVEAQAESAKVALICDGLDGVTYIRADDRRLRQVFINLLSNAVKFTSEGGEVRVMVSREGGGLAVEVRDTGIGMSEEDIAKAMEPFGQIESAMSRKHEGTGLGLPLAKRLIELHGGTMRIVSGLNAGTAVTVTLPRERIVEKPLPPVLKASA
jgi:signal transduction histidine kinase